MTKDAFPQSSYLFRPIRFLLRPIKSHLAKKQKKNRLLPHQKAVLLLVTYKSQYSTVFPTVCG